MLSYSDFGRRGHGRLANQLFQYAGMMGLASKYEVELSLPKWGYSQYFKGIFPTGKQGGFKVREPCFHYTPEFWDKIDWSKDVDIEKTWFQTENYFKDCKGVVKGQLEFQDWLIDKTKRPSQKPVIAIHVRKGDYVSNPNYANLGADYYHGSLEKHFDGDFHVRVFSDQPEWCKFVFRDFEVIEGNSDIEDLCLMSQSDHFIIANSTYSWWGAWLGEKDHSVIVYPSTHFEGELKETHNIKDYYPDRWEKSRHML